MKSEVCLLPIRCFGCGRVFDLWHDLQLEQDGIESEVNRAVRQYFCSECRPNVSFEVEQGEEAQELEFSFAY